MSGIIWLASYPKSGNTWFRVLLLNLLSEAACPVDINDLSGIPIASSRTLLDEVLGFDSADLCDEANARSRPEVYAFHAKTSTKNLIYKVHDAYTRLPNGQPIFPPDVTAASVYIIRNPLDVCVSYAHHLGHTGFDGVIEIMADPNFVISASKTRYNAQLHQTLGSWREHVLSWTHGPTPVLVVRYEDMKHHAVETFLTVAQFLGLPRDSDRIAKAIRFSAFDELKHQEDEDGFQERLYGSFFRKGGVGTWRDVLNQKQAMRIIHDHADVMRQYGYITASRDPIF